MDKIFEKIMKKNNKLHNDCDFCANCVKHYVKFNGELHLMDNGLRCICKEKNADEIKARMNNEVACEHFELQRIPPSTELENIAFALTGIMSELYEIKLILENKKSNSAKRNDRAKNSTVV